MGGQHSTRHHTHAARSGTLCANWCSLELRREGVVWVCDRHVGGWCESDASSRRLHQAAQNGDVAEMRRLLAAGG